MSNRRDDPTEEETKLCPDCDDRLFWDRETMGWLHYDTGRETCVDPEDIT
jgi:hypothetical protein